MSIKKLTTSLLRFLSPEPQIGGLEITDSVVRFRDIKKEKVVNVSLRLPPGIIELGKIKENQRPNLVAALKDIHSQLTADGKKIVNVVLTLPSSNVYIQSFNISRVAEDNLTEAAELNLRMLSPIPIETSYYGWQKIGEGETGGGAIELLGAFAPMANIDDILLALHEAGFGVAAVEFAALSLVRELKELKIIDGAQAYLVIYVNAEGLDFVVIRNGSLYFDYFYPWSLIQGDGRNISLQNLAGAIEAEMGKVFNFYAGHWGGQIKNILVITPALELELKSIIGEKFPSLQVQVLDAGKVAVVNGAYVRGKTSRAGDFDISITSESAAKIFEEEQILNFVAIWRNILFTIAGFMLLIFAATDIYLSRSADNIASRVQSAVVSNVENAELKQLEEKTKEFNKLINLVAAARDSNREISPFLIYLNNLAGQRISFDRIYLQSLERPATVYGSASSEEAILGFKKNLETQPQLADISLPLSSITMKPNGQLSFQVSFLIKSLGFPVSTPETETKLQDEKKKNESALGEQLVGVTEALKNAKPAAKGPLVVFGRLDFKSISDPVTLEVSALDEETMNIFKSKLEEAPNFYNVQIVSGMTHTDDGRVKTLLRFYVTL